MKQKLVGLLASTALLSSSLSFANKTAEIFDKNNRVLEDPPKTLRANEEARDYRIQAEAARLEKRKPASSSDNPAMIITKDLDEVPVQVPYTERPLRSGRPMYSNHGFNGERIFGIGLIGAGAYGVFGAEIEFAALDSWSVGMGLGTGMSYSTWGLFGRYFLKEGEKLSTFIQGGFTQWTLGKASASARPVSPKFLAERFFTQRNDQGVIAAQRANLIYPSVGVLFQQSTGIAATIQLQYLISLKDFSGGMFGALGMHYYF